MTLAIQKYQQPIKVALLLPLIKAVVLLPLIKVALLLPLTTYGQCHQDGKRYGHRHWHDNY